MASSAPHKKLRKREKDLRIRMIGYIRVSPNEDKESLLLQKKELQDYCINHNHILLDFIDDECGIWIRPSKREGFTKLLDKLKSGEADGVVVSKLDALGARISSFVCLLATFTSQHQHFCCIEPSIDSTTDACKSFFSLMTPLSLIDTVASKDRMNTSIVRLRIAGRCIGMAPFGQQITRDKDGRKILVDNPEELETIRIMRASRLITRQLKSGKSVPITYKEIVDILVSQGRKNREGEVKWDTARIQRIINSKAGLPVEEPKSNEKEEEYETDTDDDDDDPFLDLQ